MAESQPLLGSKSLKVHERGQCTSLYPTLAGDIYQQSTNPCGNQQEGGGPRYQQGGSQPQQLGGSVPGQPLSSGFQLQPSPRHQEPETVSYQSRGQANVLSPPILNEDQAREALLSYISHTCCWSAGPAERMVVKDIVPSSTFCYKLETLTEKRVIRNVSEPFKGQSITLLATRTTPDPWNISVNLASLFKDSQTEVEIPNTVSIENCHECYGKGFHKCNRCNGKGGDECRMCNRGIRMTGTRMTGNGNCSFCEGSGLLSCSDCHGNGMNLKCSTCDGTTKVKTFTKMTVTRCVTEGKPPHESIEAFKAASMAADPWPTRNIWKENVVQLILVPENCNCDRINKTDIVSGEGTGISRGLIKHSTGHVAFKEELPRVSPITHFQDQAINNASRQLIAKHGSNPNEKIIKQRHSVNLVPISEIRCQYKGTPIRYFVYGFDNKVYAPDYPAQCCCTVL